MHRPLPKAELSFDLEEGIPPLVLQVGSRDSAQSVVSCERTVDGPIRTRTAPLLLHPCRLIPPLQVEVCPTVESLRRSLPNEEAALLLVHLEAGSLQAENEFVRLVGW